MTSALAEPITVVRLWRDNRLDQEWEITLTDLVKRFWKSKRGRQAVNGQIRTNAALALWIGDPPPRGLGSANDLDDFDKIFDAVFEARPWKGRSVS